MDQYLDPPDTQPADFTSSSRQVLYVEDHPVNVLLMQGLVAQRPALQLAVTASAEEALRIARQHPPDLLLIDLNLPDGDGCELLARMRTFPQLAHVPAVAVTADDQARLRGTTFTEIWTKPLDLYATLDRLDALLQAGPVSGRAGEPRVVARSRVPARAAGLF